ncbi:MAG: hypothetical protein ACFCU8_16405 [Thermosynechococcaceae cyanobacterium]
MPTNQQQLQKIMDDAIQGRKTDDKDTFQPSLVDDLKKLWQPLTKA